VTVVAAAVAGYPVYVRPQIDPLRRADAIMVIGGPGSERHVTGIKLAEAGWAPTVWLSDPLNGADPWLANICDQPQAGFALDCFTPDPPTTKGEGRELQRMATEHGWRTIIVVTIRPHISRARFILERCFDGDLVMTVSDRRISLAEWVFQYVYQTAGYIRAWLQPGC
jgi:hypothetical protein